MGCTSPSAPLVIGHRGAMGYETENAEASVAKALELGVDMIEIDVFRLRDGEIVVFHDDEVDQLTDGSGPVEAFTLPEAKGLRLQGGHQIPTLDEILKVMEHRVPLNIELKGGGTSQGVRYITSRAIRQDGWNPDQFIISSFRWDELLAYRALDPNARIAVLTEGDPLEALEVARELGAEAINPSARRVTPEHVEAIHRAGFKVYVWTVNDPQQFAQLAAMGVDGCFSDYPDRMR